MREIEMGERAAAGSVLARGTASRPPHKPKVQSFGVALERRQCYDATKRDQ